MLIPNRRQHQEEEEEEEEAAAAGVSVAHVWGRGACAHDGRVFAAGGSSGQFGAWEGQGRGAQNMTYPLYTHASPMRAYRMRSDARTDGWEAHAYPWEQGAGRGVMSVSTARGQHP